MKSKRLKKRKYKKLKLKHKNDFKFLLLQNNLKQIDFVRKSKELYGKSFLHPSRVWGFANGAFLPSQQEFNMLVGSMSVINKRLVQELVRIF